MINFMSQRNHRPRFKEKVDDKKEISSIFYFNFLQEKEELSMKIYHHVHYFNIQKAHNCMLAPKPHRNGMPKCTITIAPA